jgi:hypothetical protein
MNNIRLNYVKIILLFTFSLFHLSSFGQIIIRGEVLDQKKGKLNSVAVILRNSSNSIVNYTTTNANGVYEIKLHNTGNYFLEFRHLAKESRTIDIEISDDAKEYIYDVILSEQPLVLQEVVFELEAPIFVRNDTISYKVKYFIDGTEQTVEDLLRKIPGLNIDAEGKIMVGNQEIDRLMVEGDDLFGGGYKILSKNMPAYPIEEIEIYNNYRSNHLLKGIFSESDKVALNLKLSDEYKYVWFGNVKVGGGLAEFFNLGGNLMSFGSKNKFYLLSNLNNVGFDSTGEITDLIRSNSQDDVSNIGDDQHAERVLNLSAPLPQINFRKTNFNLSKHVSANAVLNPTKKLKLNPTIFISDNRNNFYNITRELVNIHETNFTNSQDCIFQANSRTAFGKLDITYTPSPSEIIEANTRFSIRGLDDNLNLVFNEVSANENLTHQYYLVDQKISYTRKIKSKAVILATGRFVDEKMPQLYRNDHTFFLDLFPFSSDAKSIEQKAENHMNFVGLNINLMLRNSKNSLWEFHLGNEHRKDRLLTNNRLLDEHKMINAPENHSNVTEFKNNDFYLKSRYLYTFKTLTFSGRLNIHQQFNYLLDASVSQSQYPIFVNPALRVDWKINNKNKLSSYYAYNNSNSSILDLSSDLILTGQRSFTKGTGTLSLLNSSMAFIDYNFGNWISQYMLNATFIYIKNHKYYSTHTIIERNYYQTEKILINNQDFFFLNTKFDYYLPFISSNIRSSIGSSLSEFENSINHLGPRKVIMGSYHLSFELRSVFKGIFNFHLGTQQNHREIKTNSINKTSYTVSFLDLSFVFSDKFNTRVHLDQYYYAKDTTQNYYHFLTIEMNYSVIHNKLNISLSGDNLLNVRNFNDYQITDIGSVSTQYRLLPRIAMLKLEYRF